MPRASEDVLVIPYGGARDSTGPSIAIDRKRGAPLRLSDPPYPFAEPPDLFRLTTSEARLDFLRDHLKSLCGLWNRRPLAFLDAYFRYILNCLDANQAALAAMAAELGGLFEPRDWCFAALRPLPQAQLHVTGEFVRVDFAFWTGVDLVAVELTGAATPSRQRRAELARLGDQGVEVIELSGALLQEAQLPARFDNFWAGVMPPSSPFAPATLAEILPASRA